MFSVKHGLLSYPVYHCNWQPHRWTNCCFKLAKLASPLMVKYCVRVSVSQFLSAAFQGYDGLLSATRFHTLWYHDAKPLFGSQGVMLHSVRHMKRYIGFLTQTAVLFWWLFNVRHRSMVDSPLKWKLFMNIFRGNHWKPFAYRLLS